MDLNHFGDLNAQPGAQIGVNAPMYILTVGLNHKTAPVEIRERFSIPEERLAAALRTLSQTKSIMECAILSTCNRMEVYAVVEQIHLGRHYIKAFLSSWFAMEKEDFTDFLNIRENDDAVSHLFRVACGLDSMVLGETQILGQVKGAFFAAQQEGTTGTIFNTLFKQAITLAKRAHSETEIGENAVSVSYAAVELGKKIFGRFNDKSVLILGAGKMSELTAKHLHSSGVSSVTVANRTFERAEQLAEKFGGQKACTLEEVPLVLKDMDIVISSIGAGKYLLTRSQVKEALKARKNRPLFMIDIAVPRDLDPEINELDNVFLYDIDDLEGIVDANLQERSREADKIQVMIAEELQAFKKWLHTLGVVPLITALREKASIIQEEVMRSIENKLPDLEEREKRLISKHTKRIVNQLLHDPIVRIKELSAQSNAEETLELFSKIFALEERVEEIKHRSEVADNEQSPSESARKPASVPSRQLPARS